MNRRLQLINWVKAQHEGQLIKETSQPYFDHVLAVANTAPGLLTFEIGLCHDLIEKTRVNYADLLTALVSFGYEQQEAEHICSGVRELTRQFTREASPLPKKMRKELEDERLLTISPDGQTVKYADWLYNADWMMRYDRHHAKNYLQRKMELLRDMTDGDALLRGQVLQHFQKLMNEL